MWHGPGPGGGGRRGRRIGAAAAARVGLTDPNGTAARALPPAEPLPEGPQFSLRVIWANARTTWRGFRRVLALVGGGNAALHPRLALLNLVQGFLPAWRVWISKLLIDEVVAAVSNGSGLAALPNV